MKQWLMQYKEALILLEFNLDIVKIEFTLLKK